MIKSVTQHSYFEKKPNKKKMGKISKQPINWMGAPKIYTYMSISLGGNIIKEFP
jgi:hypothetical protein